MLLHFLRGAQRVWLNHKLFTVINLLCIVLTLTILLTVTALFDNAVHPIGAEHRSDRYAQVMLMDAVRSDRQARLRGPLGYKVVDAWLRPMKSAQLVAAVTLPEETSVYLNGRVTKLKLRRADAEYWQVLDFDVLSGRVPNADDVLEGRAVAVLNDSTARQLFGKEPALHRIVDVGGQPFTVIGTVADDFQLNSYSDIWVPVSTFPSSSYREKYVGQFVALLMAKDADGLQAIKREVQQIARRMSFDDAGGHFTTSFWADTKLDLFARTLLGNTNSPDSGAAELLVAVVVLMVVFMLLPALNLVNLNIGRTMERRCEIGVRKAFGATTAQLLWQFAFESVLLCLVGGVISLGCAEAVLLLLTNSGLIPYFAAHVNFAVFGYGLLAATVFGVMSGVVPAWAMSRLDPVHALKGGA